MPPPSFVWTYFTKGDGAQGKIICNICKEEYKSLSATTNLIYHLEKTHKIKRPTPYQDSVPTMTLDDMVKRKTPLSSDAKLKMDKRVLECIVAHSLPLSIVDSEYFKSLASGHDDRYSPPCSKTLRAMIVKNADMARDILRDKISSISDGACICMDLWSSDAQDSYLGITLHHVSEDFTLNETALGIIPFEHPHTSARISGELKTVMAEFGLENKVTSIVTDNGSNIRSVGQNFPGVDVLYCSAHTLQISVNILLSSCSAPIDKIRKLANHFSHSNKSNERLLNLQGITRQGKKQVSFICDTSTRWNSTYNMLVRALELRSTLSALVDELPPGGVIHLNVPSDSEYLVLQQLCSLLEPIAEASIDLQSTKISTISLVAPYVQSLIAHYSSPVNSPEVDAIRVKMLKDMEERWKVLPEAVLLGSFFDPRFKGLTFITEQERVAILNKMRIIYDTMKAAKDAVDKNGVAGSYRPNLLRNYVKRQSGDELDSYVNMLPVIHTDDFDTLLWWKTNSGNFPTLSKLAKRYLCQMPSTASVEGIFSIAGDVLGERRHSLDPELLNDLVFLKKYYQGRGLV